AWLRLREHDLAWSFRRSPVAVGAALVTLACVGAALAAPWIAPQDPFNPAAFELNQAFRPPAWLDGGTARYFLGSDDQGRDLLSAILHGARISLGVWLAAVCFALVLGVSLGLAAGYRGGWFDALVMRIADVQLSFPAIQIATAIITEATLSFLGVGLPPTRPSLGTLIRVGNDFLFSGEWWITVFPGVALVTLVLSVNLLGDWLRDALNPKLR